MYKNFLNYLFISFLILNVIWVESGNSVWKVEIESDRPHNIVKIYGGRGVWEGVRTAGGATSTTQVDIKTTAGWHLNPSAPHIERESELKKQSNNDFPYINKAVMVKDKDLTPPFWIRLYEKECNPFICLCLPLCPCFWFAEDYIGGVLVTGKTPESSLSGRINNTETFTSPGSMTAAAVRVKFTKLK